MELSEMMENDGIRMQAESMCEKFTWQVCATGIDSMTRIGGIEFLVVGVIDSLKLPLAVHDQNLV